jgi:hypothetical protein
MSMIIDSLSLWQRLPGALLSPFIRLLKMLGRSRWGLRQMWGLINAPFFRRRAFAGYQPGAEDVIVATFAKSGTNWTMQIALQIAYLGEADYEHIHDLVPWPDAPLPLIRAKLENENLAAQSPTGLRVIKTHYEQSIVPYTPEANYIVILRDPKEVFVSSYHFGRSVFGSVLNFDYSPNEWLEMYKGSNFPFGSWATHAASWWPLRNERNVFLTTFSQMKADSEATIQQIAHLMKVNLTKAQMAEVQRKSRFDFMKAIDHKFVVPIGTLFGGDDSNVQLVRKGNAGASDEMLNEVQKKQIDNFMQGELERLGSDFPYVEFF